MNNVPLEMQDRRDLYGVPKTGRTISLYKVTENSLDKAQGSKIGFKAISDIDAESYTTIVRTEGTANYDAYDARHLGAPIRTPHLVRLLATGEEDFNYQDYGTDELREQAVAGVIQPYLRAKLRYYHADRLLVISAPKDIADKIFEGLSSHGALKAKHVEIPLKEVEAHPAIKETVAAWAKENSTDNTHGVFGKNVLQSEGIQNGKLRNIRCIVTINDREKGVLLGYDGRLTILGNAGGTDMLLGFYHKIKRIWEGGASTSLVSSAKKNHLQDKLFSSVETSDG
jgi:hypothetical protein